MSGQPRCSFWTSFGPGILFAGAAIGTSHLVQATRAGSMYGLGLIGVVIIANVVKYPAFRFGPQYAASTGKSLIQGYLGLGRWVVALYVASEIGVIAIIIAATAVTTAAIILAVSETNFDPRMVGIGMIVLGVFVLIGGGYRLLDRMTKIFVFILTVATVMATIFSLHRIDWTIASLAVPEMDAYSFSFIIALMGFMPAGMDLSVMHSLWSAAKARATGHRPTMRHALADFNLGYISSACLAVCFLLMGAGVMHTEDVMPKTGASEFAAQVISLYTADLGQSVGTLVGVSAMFVMFTTLITILDGMPRLVASGITALKVEVSAFESDLDKSPLLYITTAVLALSAIFVLLFLMQRFQSFIDFVTITAFLFAPLTAILNHMVIVSDDVPAEYRPNGMMRLWSIVGIIILTGLALTFLYASAN